MLVPLLGDAIARHSPVSRRLRLAVVATGAFVVLGAALVASEVRFDWLAAAFPDAVAADDPAMAAVDWNSLPGELASRGLLGRPNLVVAATRWLDAGKIDYALGGRVPVLCLGPDPREYGIIAPLTKYAGSDVLIIAPRTSPARDHRPLRQPLPIDRSIAAGDGAACRPSGAELAALSRPDGCGRSVPVLRVALETAGKPGRPSASFA